MIPYQSNAEREAARIKASAILDRAARIKASAILNRKGPTTFAEALEARKLEGLGVTGTYTFTNEEAAVICSCLGVCAMQLQGNKEIASLGLAVLDHPIAIDILAKVAQRITERQMPDYIKKMSGKQALDSVFKG